MESWLAGAGWYDPATRMMNVEQIESFDTWEEAAAYMTQLITESTLVKSEWALYLMDGISFIYQTALDQVFFIQEV